MVNKKLKSGQVWIETVIYTLIGLALIGTVLSFALPAIQKQKDKLIIERTVEAMSEFDNNILEVKRNGVANVKSMDFSVGKGELNIDGTNDKIIFEIKESSYAFSQIGYDVKITGSNQKVLTEKSGNKYKVIMTLDYKDKINITYNLKDQIKTLTSVPIPYSLNIENNGINPSETNSFVNIDIYQTTQ